MNKRSDQVKYYDNKAREAELNVQFKNRTAQLESLEKTLIDGINHLVKFMAGQTTKTEVVNHLKEISTPDIEKLLPELEKLQKGVLDSKTDIKPLIDALNALKREVSLIPKTLPKFEQKESVKVSNLAEIKLDTSKVEEAIKKIKFEANPVVNVEKPDFKPVQDILLDILKAFNKNKVEIPKSFEVSNLKDIPATDLTKVEKKLDESNKQLKVIAEKKFGGGGGGGNGTPYTTPDGKPVNVIKGFDPGSDLTIAKTVIGNVTTYVKTDGLRTQTITINGDTGVITKEWS